MRYLRRQITHTPSHTRRIARDARAPDGAYIAAARPVLLGSCTTHADGTGTAQTVE